MNANAQAVCREHQAESVDAERHSFDAFDIQLVRECAASISIKT